MVMVNLWELKRELRHIKIIWFALPVNCVSFKTTLYIVNHDHLTINVILFADIVTNL